ncbi:MAG: NAD(P)/FAD-dependent oxidoreductase [Sphingobium sp.]
MIDEEGRRLGLEEPIARRDFIHGVASGAALGALAAAAPALGAMAAPAASGTVPEAESYPPLRTGLRGQHPGSFEMAHVARDGGFTGPVEAVDTGEHYDLVVVGGGISGLSAAYFYRKALGDDVRILVLDNHDDFGGHAKRNEFRHEGRTILSYGGTMSIETPFPYSHTSKALLAELGIVPSTYVRYDKAADVYAGLGQGAFFDKEHFGQDRTVTGMSKRPWAEFFGAAPLSPAVRADLTRLYTEKVDYMAGMAPEAKVAALQRMSYQDFLLKYAKLHPESLAWFSGMGFRNNMRVDTCPAYTAARSGRSPGFAGMTLPRPIEAEAEHFHFPDGNASIARLLVNRLVLGAFPGKLDQESIVLAPANYAALDAGAAPTRIRLGSIAVRVEHIGKPTLLTEKAVRVVYVKDGKRQSVTGANVVLACFNNIIPFIVPDLPEAQKTALQYPSKVPMQYTNVLVRNWHAWKKLGIRSITAPNGYHPNVSLDIPMKIGGYASATDPGQPVVIHMVRNPNQPGLPRKAQNKAGRADMLATSFETIEREIRSQLQRMLGTGGFDARRDILAITVNRWPHGYAYTYDTLGDLDAPDALRPHVIGRQPFGRITIANADSGAAAFTNVAMDQAERAVQECLVSRGLT